MARPKANIDWKKVDSYLKAQCDGAAIAGILGIAPLTLYRACEREHKVNFNAYAQQKKAEGKELLRAKQFQTAMDGDKTLLIWLGKQYLGQKDKQEVEQSTTVTFNDDPLTEEEKREFREYQIRLQSEADSGVAAQSSNE